MAGVINWKKVSPPGSNPDTAHVYVGVDIADNLLYIKDDTGNVVKFGTSSISSAIASALSNYDLSTVVDSKIANAINNLISGAPAALDTLNELAAALADDANFAATIASNIATVQSDIDTHEANTSNPHSTTKAQVGLGNVDNTSDINKPVSTAQAAAISTAVSNHETASDPHPQYETSAEAQAKVNAHATLTNNPHAVTKAQVGLGNVDNTSDLSKPISTATQTALNSKYDTSNPSGYQTSAQVNASIQAVVAAAPAALDTLNELAAALGNDANFAGTVTTALSGKEPTIAAGTTAQYWRGDKTWQTLNKAAVGLSNVDNTSDLNKPISTATQTALNLKYDSSNPAGYQTSAQVTTTVNNAVTTHESAADPHPQYLTPAEGNAAYAPISHTHNLSNLNQSGASFGNTIQWNGTNWVPATGIAKYVTTSTKTSTSSTVFTAIPEFNVAMTAGKSYRINIYLKHAAQTAATTGLSVAFVGTGGLTGFVTGNATFPTTTTGVITRPITALGTAVTNTGVPAVATSYLCVIEALFVCTASGTFSLSFRSEVSGSQVQTYDGSIMFVSEI